MGDSAGAAVTLALISMLAAIAASAVAVTATRLAARRRRAALRVRLIPGRTDEATPDELQRLFEVLHQLVLRRWWRGSSAQPLPPAPQDELVKHLEEPLQLVRRRLVGAARGSAVPAAPPAAGAPPAASRSQRPRSATMAASRLMSASVTAAPSPMPRSRSRTSGTTASAPALATSRARGAKRRARR